MTHTYNVTTNISVFRNVLLQVFRGRELLELMSVIVAYNEAIKVVSENAVSASIDYSALCKDAEADNIDPSDIKTLLERLSV